MTRYIKQTALDPVLVERRKIFIFFLAALAAQIALAFVMKQYRIVATAHALAVLIYGVYVLMHDAKPTRLVYVIGYLSMSEIIWRMTKAGVFWEYGKYALALLFILALFRYRLRLSALPVLYLAVLLPSIILLFGAGNDLSIIRDRISFNLSGPLSLALAALFFRQYKFSGYELRNLMLVMLVPVGALSGLVLVSTLRADAIYFSDESNFITSGGFGPNQVAAVLGLGVLLAYIYFLFEDHLPGLFRLSAAGLAVLLFIQSVLTFSRGGVFNLLLPLPLVTLASTHFSERARRGALFGVGVIVLLVYLLFPQLDSWTGGNLSQRFTDFGTSGREEIARTEFQTFLDNPYFGVGPGGSSSYTLTLGGIVAVAHTEYSRLLAEHGILGIAALIFMLLMIAQIFARGRTPAARWLALAFAAWALLDMGHAAMRLSAISLLFGLSQADYQEFDA